MPGQTLTELVARILRALEDDDAPDYRALLSGIIDDPASCEALLADGNLASGLTTELRKLRPIGLWVRDALAPALNVKRICCLDGAICRIATDAATPAPVGRECWLEVPAHEAEARARRLGAGWGLLIRGDPAAGTLAAVRRHAPLCALGLVVTTPLTSVPATRLDLVVVEERARHAHRTTIPGARVVWAGVPPEAHAALAGSGQNTGLACAADDALRWALRLALTRAPRA